jgi:hypothetical protein
MVKVRTTKATYVTNTSPIIIKSAKKKRMWNKVRSVAKVEEDAINLELRISHGDKKTKDM